MCARLILVFVVARFAASALGEEGRVRLVAGGGTRSGPCPATEARLNAPFGVDFDGAGRMYIVELTGGRLHRVDANGTLETIGGTGDKGDSGDHGPAAKAVFHAMHAVAVGSDGQVYLADTLNHRVRRYDPKTRLVFPFAGSGKAGYAGDGGPALAAECHGVYCVAFDPDGRTLYLADLENRRVRSVDMQSGRIALVAGNGRSAVPEDGAVARDSPLVDPRAVAADRAGNVWILERGGHALRVVDREGIIRTVAGTGKAGAAGDDGPAREAQLNGPKHLCLDADGNVIIADTENHLIRKYLVKEQRIERVAGTGRKGNQGIGGGPQQVELNQPHGVCWHQSGALYVVDTGNDRVLKILPKAKSGP